MSQEHSDLLALVLGSSPSRKAREESAALLAEAICRPNMGNWLEELKTHLPAIDDEELREYFQTAMLGVCVGLSDRNLSPFLPEHTEIIPPLLEDIRSVYAQVKASGAEYDPELFRHRAFDYAIHKATYLDWDLYGSKTLY